MDEGATGFSGAEEGGIAAEAAGSCGGRSMRQMVVLCAQSGSNETSPHFLLLTQPGAPSTGKCSPCLIWVFSLPLTQSRYSLTNVSRGLSPRGS